MCPKYREHGRIPSLLTLIFLHTERMTRSSKQCNFPLKYYATNVSRRRRYEGSFQSASPHSLFPLRSPSWHPHSSPHAPPPPPPHPHPAAAAASMVDPYSAVSQQYLQYARSFGSFAAPAADSSSSALGETGSGLISGYQGGGNSAGSPTSAAVGAFFGAQSASNQYSLGNNNNDQGSSEK